MSLYIYVAIIVYLMFYKSEADAMQLSGITKAYNIESNLTVLVLSPKLSNVGPS